MANLSYQSLSLPFCKKNKWFLNFITHWDQSEELYKENICVQRLNSMSIGGSSPDWLGTHSVSQANLELGALFLPTLGLQV